MVFGSSTITAFGGAASDILGGQAQAKGLRIKAMGDEAEGLAYGKAATLAKENELFTEASTAVKVSQSQREVEKSMGELEAGWAGFGGSDSGTALDLLQDSAAQGALSKNLLQQQGLITEEGYNEQAASYNLLSQTANNAANAENSLADTAERNGYITGGIKALAGVASLFLK